MVKEKSQIYDAFMQEISSNASFKIMYNNIIQCNTYDYLFL